MSHLSRLVRLAAALALALALGLGSFSAAAAQPANEPPPRMTDGSRVAVPAPARRAADDQRTIYIVVGILVLAAAFWWSRRQRDRFDAEDGIAGADAAGSAQPRADDDADDLHAAARGTPQRPDSQSAGTPDKMPDP